MHQAAQVISVAHSDSQKKAYSVVARYKYNVTARLLNQTGTIVQGQDIPKLIFSAKDVCPTVEPKRSVMVFLDNQQSVP